LEAVKSQKTANEIASEYGDHVSQINDWKKHLIEEWPEIFDRGKIKQAATYEQERVQRLMQQMGLVSIAPKPHLSAPAKTHKTYPYLLIFTGHPADQPSRSGLVLGHHLPPARQRVRLPDSGDGFIQPLCAVLGGVRAPRRTTTSASVCYRKCSATPLSP
jgi:transposase